MALLLLWWQPVDLRIDAVPMLVIKLLALVAVGESIVRRARDLAALAEPHAEATREPAPSLAPNIAPSPST
jgi:hypothetical protein